MAQTTMTEDEIIEFFASETEKAAKRASRRTLRAALVGYLVLFVGVFGMYWNGQHVSGTERQAVVDSGRVVAIAGCNRSFKANQGFRALFTRLIRVTEAQAKRGEISQYQAQQSLRFYRAERAKIKLPDCRQAGRILTDDPEADIRHIPPLYPGSAG